MINYSLSSKAVLLYTFLLFYNTSCNLFEKSHELKSFSCIEQYVIDSTIALCFSQYFDTIENVNYNFPVVIKNGSFYTIDGVDSFYNFNFISFSPHKKYLMLSKIGYSYIFENNSKFFEKYSQIIIDLKKVKVIEEIYGNNCDGFWSINDEWINAVDSNVVFP